MGKILCLSFLLLSTFYYNVHCQEASTNTSESSDSSKITNFYKNFLKGLTSTDSATLDQLENALLTDKDNEGSVGTGKVDSSIPQSISDSGGSLDNYGSGGASSNEANSGIGGSNEEPFGDNSSGSSGSQLSGSGTGGSSKGLIEGNKGESDYVGGTGSSGSQTGGFSGSSESAGANKGSYSGSDTSTNSGFQTGGQSSVDGSSESGNGGDSGETSGESMEENGDNALSYSGNSRSGSGDSMGGTSKKNGKGKSKSDSNGKADSTGELQTEVKKIKLSLENSSGFVSSIFWHIIHFISNFQNVMSHGEYYVKNIQSFVNGALDTAGNTLSVPEKTILNVVGRILSTVLSIISKLTSYLPIVGNRLSTASNKVSVCVSRTTYELDKPVVESLKSCVSSPVNKVGNTMTQLMADFKQLSLFLQLIIGRFFSCKDIACRVEKVSKTVVSVAPVLFFTGRDFVTGIGSTGLTLISIMPCFTANIPFSVIRNIISKSVEMFKCMF